MIYENLRSNRSIVMRWTRQPAWLDSSGLYLQGAPGHFWSVWATLSPKNLVSQDSPTKNVINFFWTPCRWSPQPNQYLSNLKFSTTYRWQWWGQSHGTGGTHYGQRQIGRPLWSEDISWGDYAICPYVLRIQFKLNTALLSTVRASVRVFVCHRRDISHFSHI